MIYRLTGNTFYQMDRRSRRRGLRLIGDAGVIAVRSEVQSLRVYGNPQLASGKPWHAGSEFDDKVAGILLGDHNAVAQCQWFRNKAILERDSDRQPLLYEPPQLR